MFKFVHLYIDTRLILKEGKITFTFPLENLQKESGSVQLDLDQQLGMEAFLIVLLLASCLALLALLAILWRKVLFASTLPGVEVGEEEVEEDDNNMDEENTDSSEESNDDSEGASDQV